MATKNEIALISAGWGPRCLSHAGVTLLGEVYRVETFGLDPVTRTMISQLHSLSTHSPVQEIWQNSELLAVAARALRLAQSDERAALVTPSGAIATAIWPVVQAAAAKLEVTVRVAHGLGLAESLANCFQLPLPPITELRRLLSDFVGEQRMPSLVIAHELGDLTEIRQLYDAQGAFFVVDLFAQRVTVMNLDVPPIPAPNHLFVATQGAIALALDNDDSPDISGTIATTADWFELLNGLTGVARG